MKKSTIIIIILVVCGLLIVGGTIMYVVGYNTIPNESIDGKWTTSFTDDNGEITSDQITLTLNKRDEPDVYTGVCTVPGPVLVALNSMSLSALLSSDKHSIYDVKELNIQCKCVLDPVLGAANNEELYDLYGDTIEIKYNDNEIKTLSCSVVYYLVKKKTTMDVYDHDNYIKEKSDKTRTSYFTYHKVASS